MLPVKNWRIRGSSGTSCPGARPRRSSTRRSPASRCPRTDAGRRRARSRRAPVSSSGGPCTSRNSCQPTSQQSAADDHARARSVPSTLRRSRRGASRRDEPRPDQDDPERPEPEHHERVAEEPVAEPAPPRPGAVLLDRQGLDVADAAPVEVAGRSRGGRRACGATTRTACRGATPSAAPSSRVRALRAQERAVGAVVEDDERADEEAGRDQRERHRECDRDPEREARRHDRAPGTGRPR